MAHLVTFVVSVIATLITPKVLGVEGYAQYAVVYALINFLIPISSFGLVPFIIRNFKNRDGRAFDLHKVSLILFWIGTLLASLVLILQAWLAESKLFQRSDYLVVLGAVISTASLVVASGYYRAADKAKIYFLLVAGQKILALVSFLLIFYFVRNDYLAFFYGIVLSNIVVAFLVRFRLFPPDEGKLGIEQIAVPLKVCAAIMCSNALLLFLPWFERQFLFSHISSLELSKYVFNAELTAKLLAGVLLVLKVVVYPKVMSGSPAAEVAAYHRAMKGGAIVVCLVYLLAIAVSYYFYEPLLKWFFSDTSFSSLGYFQFQMAYSCLVVVSYISYIGVMLTGKTLLMVLGSIALVAIDLSCLLLLVDGFGAYAAIIGLVIGQLASIAICILGNKVALREYLGKTSNV